MVHHLQLKIGRAGRSGEPAKSTVYWLPSDARFVQLKNYGGGGCQELEMFADVCAKDAILKFSHFHYLESESSSDKSPFPVVILSAILFVSFLST